MTKDDMIEALVNVAEKPEREPSDLRSIRDIVTETVNQYFSERGKAAARVMSPARKAAAQRGAERFRARPSNTGYPGVHIPKGQTKAQARVRIDGKVKFLGTFDTPELAAAAVKEAKGE